MPAKSVTYNSQNYAGTLGSGLVVTNDLLQKTKMKNKLNQFSEEGTFTSTIKNSKDVII